MRPLFVTDPPPPVEDWLAHRRALGQDRFDEVWEGDYHVAPAPSGRHAELQVQVAIVLRETASSVGLVVRGPSNIGDPSDYRVPDLVLSRDPADQVWYPTAAIVVEVVSPGDESRQKLGFYHRVGVEEVVIVDPERRTVEWFARSDDAFVATGASAVVGLNRGELVEAIDWPA
ncbi:MAG: Uma2 family endonuclease [Chloroflexota bacterium]